MQLVSRKDKILYKRCIPIHEAIFGKESLANCSKDMLQIMQEANGIGIAAPQVGHQLQMAWIISQNGAPLFICNPVLLYKSRAKVLANESCLSAIGLVKQIERAKAIQLSYVDLHGNHQLVQLEGLAAVVAQHEIDHLHGKVIWQ